MGDMGTFVAVIIALLLLGRFWKRTARPRRRASPFKERYDLNRCQPIPEFERKLARAMFAEVKEVFVTAFCTENEVLRVTATIGTTYRCRPSDRVDLWGQRAVQLQATQVRQYHNHPHIRGRSKPSRQDYRSNKSMRSRVEPYGIRFHGFLIYKPWLGRYTIKEYR
jgi:DNA repair protein RadC